MQLGRECLAKALASWTSLTHNRAMLTRDQLADLLATVNVREVAREADVSTKTIYRLRNKQNSPTLDTVEQIVAAVRRLRTKRKS
jgi:DNA-binding phage protein